MSIGIGQNISNSFGFALDSTVKHIGRWIVMGILLCIPIVDLIVLGMCLKALRNEEVDFSNIGKSFVQGLLTLIIAIIYFIVPTIIFMILGGAGFIAGAFAGSSGSVVPAVAGFGIGATIALIISIFISLISNVALVRYAREEKFGAAFQFSEIFAMIKKLGWGKYIVSLILLYIVLIVALIILGIIQIIPIIGLIVIILAAPILSLFLTKFLGNLFE